MRKPEILDCTLRDASYPIHYQFTAEDTAVIAVALEHAGFRKIEIGHGLGLAASSPAFGIAAASDEEYLEAAGSVLSLAKYGVFVIPGIATVNHMNLVAKYKAGFVRVGTNVNDTEQAEPFIKKAKELGLEVASNLMKTYAASIDEVLRRAEDLQRWGVDTICVVDSAGGMFPQDVTNYVSQLKRNTDLKIGFHGHNNMQLAIANTIAAIQAGAEVVDCTLRGMGRSSGNAQTEVLILALMRMGIDMEIDIYKMMDIGDRLIAPMAQGRGVDSIELVSGFALFHSSYMKIIDRISREENVDPRKLIIGVSQINKIEVTEELARNVAFRLKKESQSKPKTVLNFPMNLGIQATSLAKTSTPAELTKIIASELQVLSKKTCRSSVFTISFFQSGEKDQPQFPFIRWNALNVIGNAEVQSIQQAIDIAQSVDGSVDFVLLDGEMNSFIPQDAFTAIKSVLKRSKLLTYRDSAAHIDATEAVVWQLLQEREPHTLSLGISGLTSYGLKLAMKLLERGACVALWDKDSHRLDNAYETLCNWFKLDKPKNGLNLSKMCISKESVDILIGTSLRETVINESLVKCVKPKGVIIDGGIGTLASDAIALAIRRGLQLFRLDMRAGLFGQIALTLETRNLIQHVIGKNTISGINVVAGGYIGQRGSVVVDIIENPSRVVGIADGVGHLLKGAEMEPYLESVKAIKTEILRRMLPV